MKIVYFPCRSLTAEQTIALLDEQGFLITAASQSSRRATRRKTEEDSGNEDEGVSDNLSGYQLHAVASATVVAGERWQLSEEEEEDAGGVSTSPAPKRRRQKAAAVDRFGKSGA